MILKNDARTLVAEKRSREIEWHLGSK